MFMRLREKLKKVMLAVAITLLVCSVIQADNTTQILDLLRSIDVDVYDPPKAAPDFTLPGVYGDSVTLSQMDQGLIFLSIWTTWCGYCKKEAPSKNNIWNEFKDLYDGKGFYMIAASVEEEKDVVQYYLESNGYTYPTYLDSDASVKTAYNVAGYPTSLFIVGGKVVGEHPGPRYWDDPAIMDVLRQVIDLAAPQPDPINVALGKPVVVSGEYSPAYPKTGLTDGNDATVWGSLYNSGDQWFYVDLGEATDIIDVNIKFYNPYYAPTYYVGVSNDAANWDFAATINNGNGGSDLVPVNRNARYVGILLRNGAMKVYGVKEFEVMAIK